MKMFTCVLTNVAVGEDTAFGVPECWDNIASIHEQKVSPCGSHECSRGREREDEGKVCVPREYLK